MEEGSTVEWFTWAVAPLKWNNERCVNVFDTFRDHWKAQPGQKGVKADWEATWRNWCRREASFAKPSKNSELKVREMTDDARFNQEMMRQRKLPGNTRKSDAEIAKLAHVALYGSAA